LLLLGLFGCAHETTPRVPHVASTSPAIELRSGSIRLNCESLCALRWKANSQHLKALHDNKLWTDLSNQVRDLDHLSDLSYYYLGRAAEGLGHTDAAMVYYRLALTYLHRCDGWLSECDGFDFPKDIRVRLAGLSKVKVQASPESNPPSLKINGLPNIVSAELSKPEPLRSGTGFFIHPEGIMVTSLHLVDQANRITISTQGERKHSAELLVKNAPCDLAVVKVALRVNHWLPIQRDAKKIKRGSEVLTVGFPRVNLQGLESKVTHGLISSLTGVANDPNFLQISVPIQPGNSGGPLVSREGLVVGIISSKLASPTSFNSTNVQPENVNYAVKSSCLRDLLRTLPSKYRYDTKKNPKFKTLAKNKTKSQSKELSMIELTARVEKTVALVLVHPDSSPYQSAP
jgi:S1-C subfamily serine protease